jgi:hypothetical protein
MGRPGGEVGALRPRSTRCRMLRCCPIPWRYGLAEDQRPRVGTNWCCNALEREAAKVTFKRCEATIPVRKVKPAPPDD